MLLSRWLDQAFASASEADQSAFEHLLEREDDEIWDWMMGRAAPPQDLLTIVQLICSQHEASQGRV